VSLRGRVADASHEKLALKTAENCEGVSKVIDLIES
jgi:osmotically-inducible protein OsmY